MPARSFVLSFDEIGSFVAGPRASLMAIVILFGTGLTSVAFAGERRVLAMADTTIYAGSCGGCGSVSHAVPSPYSDGTYRSDVVGPYAYANSENDAVTQVMPRRPALNQARVSMPNVVVVNGQRIEIVSPDEVNSLDRAADVPSAGQRDVKRDALAAPFERTADQLIKVQQADAVAIEQPALRAVSVSPTLLAQALSVIAGALAGAAVGWWLIGWNPVRISSLPDVM